MFSLIRNGMWLCVTFDGSNQPELQEWCQLHRQNPLNSFLWFFEHFCSWGRLDRTFVLKSSIDLISVVQMLD